MQLLVAATVVQLRLLLLILMLAHSRAASSGQPPPPARRLALRATANFRSPGNWRSGAAPCPHDSARLPERSPVLVGLAAPPLTARELLLPRDGAGLVLFEGAGLRAFDEAASTAGTAACAGAAIRDAVFNLTEPLRWFQPSNWRLLSKDAEIFDALPIDQLPGDCDAVVFEPSTSYFVERPSEESGQPAPVAQVEIDGRTFAGGDSGSGQAEFQAYWRGSDFARAQFHGGASAADDPTPPLRLGVCDAALGAVPQPLQLPGLMSSVCRSVICPATAASCGEPIPAKSVSGACCDLCGPAAAAVWLQPARGGGFDLRRLRQRLADAVRRMAPPPVPRLSLLRVPDSSLGVSGVGPLYQLVVVLPDGGGSSAAVDDVMERLESWAPDLRYTTVKILRSENTGARTQGQSDRLAAGWAAGLTVCLILAAAAAVAVVAHVKGWWSPLDLRKVWLAWRQRRHQQLQEQQQQPAGAAGLGDAVDFSACQDAVSFTRAGQTISMAFTNPVFDEVSQPQEGQDLPTEDREM